MGETKGSLVRVALTLYLIHFTQCHMNLDPKRDPVLQRLDIPAQESAVEQEFTLEPKTKSIDQAFVRRLWGIPDVTAEVGKEFNLAFPSDAFEGFVSRYEVARSDSQNLPSWLHFDREKGTLLGKPQPDHVGNWYIKVRAYGAHPHHVATDVFAIQVVNQTCSHLALSLTFDLDFFTLSPKSRQRLVSSLSRHFHVPATDVTLKESRTVKPTDWIKAGAGNVLLPVNSHLTNAVVRFQCSRVNDTALWAELKKKAANGELADRFGHSITGWVLTQLEAEPGRIRRAVADEGSGDDEEYDYEDNHEDDEQESEILPETAVVPSQKSPVREELPSPTPTIPTTPTTPNPTAAMEPISPVQTEVEATPVLKAVPSSSIPAAEESEIEARKSESQPLPVTPSAEPAPPTAFPDDYDENEVEGTEEESVKTPHNNPPVVNKRLPRLTVTAGKVLRFTVPHDTFTDIEDGSARSLKLKLIPAEGRELSDIPWIGFDAQEQTLYGLPLAEDIGRWSFILQATDKKGESAQEQVEVVVRQHQSERTFNHRFSTQLKPEFSEDEMSIPRAHWLLSIVEAIYKTAGDKSEDSVVVRSLAGDFKNDQPFSLSWVNESLSRQHCQEDAIHEILEKFFHTESSEITQEFEDNLPLQFVATSVSIELEGICKSVPTAATLPPVREIAPVTEKVNEPPQVRNPVDQIAAEAGMLLRFQVPEDTFFDAEDGNTRMLRLQLLSSDRQPLDSKLWLQFDAPNQEFYGLPLESDAGSEEYQLRATDTTGLTAHDGLVVFVKPRPKEESFSVEFSLRINVDHESVATSAHRKARLIETIAEIFGDSDSRNIVVKSLAEGSTIISWSNKSLAVSPCPEPEIRQLRRALLDEEGKLTPRAAELLSGADFEPISATLLPLGACVGELTPTHAPDAAAGEEVDTEKPESEGSWTDDYLVTFIVPGIIIAAMLLLAAVIACVLYRRRRTGKLGLEERRSFVSKGIPIIFAEELEERPSSGRHSVKSPVILKDERPAQPPPDYRKVRSSASPNPQRIPSEQRDLLRSPSDETPDDEPAAPYQPPPPLAAGSGRDSVKSARPKATSAYRKPPPYVPP